MNAYAVSELAVSTSFLLILATQLAFSAAFSFVLVRQRLTPLSVNAIVLLTTAAGILVVDASGGDRPAGESTKKYITGVVLTLLAAALYGVFSPFAAIRGMTAAVLGQRCSLLPPSSFRSALFVPRGNSSPSRSRWVIDSGSSDHLTGRLNILSNYRPLKTAIPIGMANGSRSLAEGVGSIDLTSSLHLSSVLYIPGFPHNIISVHKISSQGSVNFYPEYCLIRDRWNTVIGKGIQSNSIYELDETFATPIRQPSLSPSRSVVGIPKRRRCFGPIVSSSSYHLKRRRENYAGRISGNLFSILHLLQAKPLMTGLLFLVYLMLLCLPQSILSPVLFCLFIGVGVYIYIGKPAKLPPNINVSSSSQADEKFDTFPTFKCKLGVTIKNGYSISVGFKLHTPAASDNPTDGQRFGPVC